MRRKSVQKRRAWIGIFSAIIALTLAAPIAGLAQEPEKPSRIETYKTIEKADLKAHIFLPADSDKSKRRPAIVLLHGGGWNAGSPEWVYWDAAHYAGLGFVAIAGEYRLSDRKETTPLEAMEDVRDLIRWTRQHAQELGVDPHRVAVYGVSAGGHLAASAAVFPHGEESKISAEPDALILLSPAVSLVNDNWPQMLLGSKGKTRDISPAENIKTRLPPIFIAEGEADTETPPGGVSRLCERAKELGGVCELHLYPGVGHILTRNLDPHAQEEGPFDPDPKAVADAHAKKDAFLARLGFAK